MIFAKLSISVAIPNKLEENDSNATHPILLIISFIKALQEVSLDKSHGVGNGDPCLVGTRVELWRDDLVSF